jgi:hypothetical protein
MARTAPPRLPGTELAFTVEKGTFSAYGPSSPSAEDGIGTVAPRISIIIKRQSMRTLRLLSSILGLIGAGALNAADNPAPRTEVVFDHPENFTDAKDSYAPTDKGRDSILANIRDFLVHRTDTLLPEGYKLRITFTDIDLAGEFEPWRGAQYDNVRIVKAIYPPAFKFTYVVTDPSGKAVRQGSENIRDLNFQVRVTMDLSDPLRYEKDILDDWARSRLNGLKKR